MATTKACLGRVEVGSGPTVVGEVRSISMPEEVSANEVGAMGTCEMKYDGGPSSVNGSMTCWFDAADAGQNLLLPGSSEDIIYQPAGQGSSLPQLKLTGALITRREVSAEFGGTVEISFGFSGGAIEQNFGLFGG